ncbi:MAG: glutathione S-transferase family protein [Oligoflexales bacterium]
MIKLYAHSSSPYSQRASLLLEELKLEYKFISVNFEQEEHKSDQFQILNPYGRVPCLEWNEIKISESLAICRYLIARTEAFHLYPSNILERALVDQWVDYTNIHLGLAFTNLAWQRYWCPLFGMTTDHQHANRLEKRIKKELPILEHQLTNRSYLLSESPTLCDFSFFPQIGVYDKAKISLEEYPKIMNWLKIMTKRDTWKALLS